MSLRLRSDLFTLIHGLRAVLKCERRARLEYVRFSESESNTGDDKNDIKIQKLTHPLVELYQRTWMLDRI